MHRHVIFVFSTVLFAFGVLAQADGRQNETFNDEAGEPVFVDVVIKNLANEPLNVEFGPCRWKVSGEIVSNSSIGKVDTTNLVTHAERGNGYRMGLVCQESRQKDLEVKLGFGRNVSSAQILKSESQIFIEPINENSIYLTFTKKWGGVRP